MKHVRWLLGRHGMLFYSKDFLNVQEYDLKQHNRCMNVVCCLYQVLAAVQYCLHYASILLLVQYAYLNHHHHTRESVCCAGTTPATLGLWS